MSKFLLGIIVLPALIAALGSLVLMHQQRRAKKARRAWSSVARKFGGVVRIDKDGWLATPITVVAPENSKHFSQIGFRRANQLGCRTSRLPSRPPIGRHFGMVETLAHVLAVLHAVAAGRAPLDVENVALRQQLIVLQRGRQLP